MSISQVKAAMPPQHHAAFDTAMKSVPQADQPKVGGFLANLIAILKSMGLAINWTCLIQIIPQVIAAFSNPALWPAVLAAYFACANP